MSFCFLSLVMTDGNKRRVVSRGEKFNFGSENRTETKGHITKNKGLSLKAGKLVRIC